MTLHVRTFFEQKKMVSFQQNWAPATPEFLLPVASLPPWLPALPSLPSPLALLSPWPWPLQLRAEAPLHSGQGGPNSVRVVVSDDDIS